jgi:hypothetical protein
LVRKPRAFWCQIKFSSKLFQKKFKGQWYRRPFARSRSMATRISSMPIATTMAGGSIRIGLIPTTTGTTKVRSSGLSRNSFHFSPVRHGGFGRVLFLELSMPATKLFASSCKWLW